MRIEDWNGHSFSEEFPCPWCGQPLRLWPETFKGSGTRRIQTVHPHNQSSNCNASVPQSSTDQGKGNGE